MTTGVDMIIMIFMMITTMFIMIMMMKRPDACSGLTPEIHVIMMTMMLLMIMMIFMIWDTSKHGQVILERSMRRNNVNEKRRPSECEHQVRLAEGCLLHGGQRRWRRRVFSRGRGGGVQWSGGPNVGIFERAGNEM